MKRILLLVAVVLIAACEATPIVFGPEPSGGTSSGATMGAGGNSAGLSCDPCESKDGTRIVRKRQVFSSPDGLRNASFVVTYWDKLRNEPCTLNYDEAGVGRCFPAGGVMYPYFVDPNCTMPVTARPMSACSIDPLAAPYALLSVPNMDPCKPGFVELHAPGQPAAGPFYIMSNGMCVQTTPIAGYNYFTLGAKVPSTEFAEMNVGDVF